MLDFVCRVFMLTAGQPQQGYDQSLHYSLSVYLSAEQLVSLHLSVRVDTIRCAMLCMDQLPTANWKTALSFRGPGISGLHSLFTKFVKDESDVNTFSSYFPLWH